MTTLSTTKALRSRLLFALLSCLCVLPFMVSCLADNEPDEMTNEYYVTVETKNHIYRRGGLPPGYKDDMIGKISKQMMTKMKDISNFHRKTDGLIVHDAAVQRSRDAEAIAACDSIYRFYIETGFLSSTVCKVTLYRARMQDGIIRGSHKLKTYPF